MDTMTETPLLDGLDRELMLRSAHRFMRRKYRRRPLWVFVSDITCHGSTYSHNICLELGWNPDEDGSKPLPQKLTRTP